MKGTLPPPNRFPNLADKTLVDADRVAMGFLSIPGLPETIPTNFIMPVFDYDFGSTFN